MTARSEVKSSGKKRRNATKQAIVSKFATIPKCQEASAARRIPPVIARTVAVAHHDRRGRRNSDHDHIDDIGQRQHHLMCCQRHGPDPSHHNQRECESRHFEHHLHRDRQADRKQPACRPPSLCNPGKEQEITPQRRYGEEITERKKRHADTRDEGGQSAPAAPISGNPQ